MWAHCPFSQWEGPLGLLVHKALMCEDEGVKCPLQLLARWSLTDRNYLSET